MNKNYMVEMFEQHERNISIKKMNPGMSYPEYGSDASVSEQKLADEDSEKTEVRTQTFYYTTASTFTATFPSSLLHHDLTFQ